MSRQAPTLVPLVATSVALAALALMLALAPSCSTEEDTPRTETAGSATPQPASDPTSPSPGGPSPGPSPGTPSGPDELETVDWAGGTAFQIFRYEAAVDGGKAVSRDGQQPTVNIDYDGAKAACTAAGYRLCTLTEWIAACKGKEKLKFGYAATADGPPPVTEACDVARTTNNTPGSLPSPTGSHADCIVKGTSIHDMVGNLSEWSDGTDGTPVAAGVAFYQPAEESHCDQTLTGSGKTMDPKEKSTDLGFRCCK